MQPNVQKAMVEGAQVAEQSLCKWLDENENGIRDKMVSDKAFQVVSLPDADVTRWKDVQVDIANKWCKLIDDNGRKGSEVPEALRNAK